jgi:hypothetical protein
VTIFFMTISRGRSAVVAAAIRRSEAHRGKDAVATCGKFKKRRQYDNNDQHYDNLSHDNLLLAVSTGCLGTPP